MFETILSLLEINSMSSKNDEEEKKLVTQNKNYLMMSYVDSMRYTASLCRQTDEPIDIKVDSQTILKITDLIDNKASLKNEFSLYTLTVLLISPPYPFVNSLVNQTSFVSETLLQKTD